MTKQIYRMTPDVVGFLLGMGESEWKTCKTIVKPPYQSCGVEVPLESAFRRWLFIKPRTFTNHE